ncbi:MAG: protease inhibitor I42 family protein [Actinobacteria bacterium]|nr:protease inhibitor I42 family protein [Actinomycetota bacterium]
MSTISLGTVDNGTTIDAVVGDVIVVRLAENPTTGYRWSLESVEGSLLETKDDRFVLDSGPQTGSGGTRRFQFRAAAAGTTPIHLKHWREWAGEDSVTERYAVGIEAVAGLRA